MGYTVRHCGYNCLSLPLIPASGTTPFIFGAIPLQQRIRHVLRSMFRRMERFKVKQPLTWSCWKLFRCGWHVKLSHGVPEKLTHNWIWSHNAKIGRIFKNIHLFALFESLYVRSCYITEKCHEMILQTCLKSLNIYISCRVYSVCVSKIKCIFSIIFYAINAAVIFSLLISLLKIAWIFVHQPLSRVMCWNNGMQCISCYGLTIETWYHLKWIAIIIRFQTFNVVLICCDTVPALSAELKWIITRVRWPAIGFHLLG